MPQPTYPEKLPTVASTPRRRPATMSSNRGNRAQALSRQSEPFSSSEVERNVARFLTRPNQLFQPSVPVREWRYIIVHHSAEPNGSFASIDRYHREVNGWDECGYHFVIGNGTESGDGEIEVGGRWTTQKHGAHTKPGNNEEYNNFGIGICLIGNFNQDPPTPKQVEACRRLISYLEGRCDVSARHITTHGSVPGTHTDCPGKYFPYDQLLPRPGFATR